MIKCVLVLMLCVTAVPAMAVDLFHPAAGPPHQGEGGTRALWSEPPDLNGLIGSSEQILAFGFETELANDFSITEGGIGEAAWWGGYWNNSVPCDPGMTPSGFNLRFYDDAGCIPGNIIADISVTNYTQESVGCQQGFYPMYRWGGDTNVAVVPGDLYWFGAQMKDHPFPPQSGRLASMSIIGCDTLFKSAYFSYPDWTPAIDVFGVAFDASQEFYQGIPDWDGACCIGDQGECQVLTQQECSASGGRFMGAETTCDPNPCEPVPTRSTSWGKIKEQFR